VVPVEFGLNIKQVHETSQQRDYVLSPATVCVSQKGTKNALETGRTFATLFADTDLRVRLLGARTENDFKRLLWEQMKELAEEQQDSSGSRGRKLSEDSADEKPDESTPTPVSTSSFITNAWLRLVLRV